MPHRRLPLVLAVLSAVTLPLSAQMTNSDLSTIRNYRLISDDLGTAGQIAYDQIATLKDEGYEVVVNLAPAREGANALEGFLVVEQGLSYIHIPVSWTEPGLRDLDLFFAVMEANRDRKVFVHCFANMRVSAFVYLYRTLVLGLPEAEARADLTAIWDPAESEQWADLIARAQTRHADAENDR